MTRGRGKQMKSHAQRDRERIGFIKVRLIAFTAQWNRGPIKNKPLYMRVLGCLRLP